ncbi:MAG: DUF2147 domain-containing protein [Bacteroidales bacterium]|nr:DUF2147 domain-containing protein [Bacteroidales bacterium]
MKKNVLIIIAVFFALSFYANKVQAQASKITGMWKTIDDETGKAKSYVKIYKARNGFYYGKITKLLLDPQDKKCDKCKGALKDKPVVGMIILLKMKAGDDGLEGGKIMDPGNGKFYHCTMEIDRKNPNKLEVRGSIDSWGWAGRTQYWYRLKQ